MELAGTKINQLTIDFSLFKDLDYLISLELCSGGTGNRIIIKGANRICSDISVTYEISRECALRAGILKENYR